MSMKPGSDVLRGVSPPSVSQYDSADVPFNSKPVLVGEGKQRSDPNYPKCNILKLKVVKIKFYINNRLFGRLRIHVLSPKNN